MKIYIELPLTNTLINNDSEYSANLTDDYAAHFKTAGRYKFQVHSKTRYKRAGCGSSESISWIYTIVDPRTFVLM